MVSQDKKKEHVHQGSGSIEQYNVCLSQRVLTLLGAACVIVFFVLFMAGYFCGKQSALAQFSLTAQQESLADQIYASVYAAYASRSDECDDEESGDNEEAIVEVPATLS